MQFSRYRRVMRELLLATLHTQGFRTHASRSCSITVFFEYLFFYKSFCPGKQAFRAKPL